MTDSWFPTWLTLPVIAVLLVLIAVIIAVGYFMERLTAALRGEPTPRERRQLRKQRRDGERWAQR